MYKKIKCATYPQDTLELDDRLSLPGTINISIEDCEDWALNNLTLDVSTAKELRNALDEWLKEQK
jgi:hypothetical protein